MSMEIDYSDLNSSKLFLSNYSFSFLVVSNLIMLLMIIFLGGLHKIIIWMKAL